VTDDLRVATLAALLAPARAPGLLARLGTPGARDASAHAQRLLAAPRPERLQALSAALAPGREARGRTEALASLERERVAALLRALGADGAHPGPAPGSPLLLRLCRERLGR
jgi:hypothetical protein